MQVPAKIYQLVLIKTVVVLETFQMAVSRLCMCPRGGGVTERRQKAVVCRRQGGTAGKRNAAESVVWQPRRRNEALEGDEEWKKMGGQRGEAVGDGAGMRERDANGG